MQYKNNRTVWMVLGISLLMASCVGSKKYKNLEQEYGVLNNKFTQLTKDLQQCENDKLKMGNNIQSLEGIVANQKEQINVLKEQSDYLKGSNSEVMNRLAEMNVLTGKQAESVGESLRKLGERDAYIKDLQGEMARKDSLNMALVMNLKGSLGALDDEDIDIQVEKGVVFISISDKLLFSSGSYEVSSKAYNVLEKIAVVLNNQPNIEFLVEGHTDNVPVRSGAAIRDNWDLSVLRAASVVRILQDRYKIDPKRMTAGGRSQYIPVATNENSTGRAANRRTRIVVLPQLDQFFQLLEPNTQATKPGE